MERIRRVVLFSVGLAMVALIDPCGAAAAPQDQAASGLLTAVTGQPSSCGCEDKLSCSCACSPLAGAWVARLSAEVDGKVIKTADGKDDKDGKGEDDKNKKIKRVIQTFKFAPVNAKCDKFVVNAQATTRPERVIHAFPEVTDLTEFVGIACKTEPGEVDFTAISYGVERTDETDKTVLIAVLSGTIELPGEWGKDGDHSSQADGNQSYKCKCCKDGCKDPKCSCKTGDHSNNDGHPGKCSCCKDSCKYADCECKTGNYWDHRECNEPEELCAELTVAYYDAEQDEDGDGFPDEGEEAVVCLSYEAKLKRVELKPQCKPAKKPVVTATPGVQG